MRSASQHSLNQIFNSSGCPATISLIAINVVTFFVGASMRGGPIDHLAFFGHLWLTQPWTLFTWAFISGNPMSLLFGGLMAFFFCGSLERSWGTRTFTVVFLVLTAMMALSVWIGGMLLNQPTVLAGLYLSLAAPIVAWCAVNRNEVIRVYGILPVTSPLLAIFTLVLTWYYVGPPFLGLFALTSCLAAYWYAKSGRHSFHGYASNRSFVAPRGPNLRLHTVGEDREQIDTGLARFSPWRRYRAWQERRKLERLWKRSFSSDSSKKDR